MTAETETQRAEKPSRILSDIAGFASSQYTLRVAYLIKGFLVARILGPVGNGMWQHFMLVFEYSQYAHGGLLPGLSKHLGHEIGRGDELSVLDARRSGVGGALATSVGLLLVILGYVAFHWETIHPVDRWGVPLIGLIGVIEQLTNAYKAVLRAYSRIGVISRVAFAFAISNFVVSIVLLVTLPPGLKMLGLLVAWLVTRTGTTAWLLRQSGIPFQPQLDPTALRVLLVTGFPIFLFHLTQVALKNIDRVLVDMVLDKEDLGIYGIAVALATLVRFGTEAIAFVIYPIFLRRYGETREPRALRRHLVEPTAFLAVAVPLALGLSYLVLHLPVLWLLPRYVPSIDIFRLLTVSVVFSCLAILPAFYLMAIDRQNWLVPVGAVTVGFDWAAGYWLVHQGWGMQGVAAAMGVGSFLYATSVLLLSGRLALASVAAGVTWTLRTYLPVGYSAAAVAAILWVGRHSVLSAWTETPRSLAEGALFLLLAAPLAVGFERRTGFLRQWRTGRRPGP